MYWPKFNYGMMRMLSPIPLNGRRVPLLRLRTRTVLAKSLDSTMLRRHERNRPKPGK